jgi:hypothetical protein
MHKIEFNYHDSIVRVVITGHLTIMEIEQLSGELQNNVTDKNSLLLTDARGVIYDFNTDDLKTLGNLIEITNEKIKPENMVFEAVLIDSPKESALIILFNLKKKKYNHVYNIFSTEEAAINWLLSNKK